MVSNKKRNVEYDDITVRKEAVKEFNSCRAANETKTDTMLKICKSYKSKCLGHMDQGVVTTD